MRDAAFVDMVLSETNSWCFVYLNKRNMSVYLVCSILYEYS